jgi:hypothetical protein
VNPLGYAPPTHGPLFPDARLDAQPAHDAATAAVAVGDPHVAHRRHDAHSEPSPHDLPVEQLPPPPLYPPAGYALPILGPFSRRRRRTTSLPPVAACARTARRPR